MGQLQNSKSSEQRMRMEAERLRADTMKQSSLFNSLQKIELSLSAKSNSEQQTLKEELEKLKQTLKHERETQKKEVYVMLDCIRDYELQVLTIQKSKEESLRDMFQAKE